MIIKYANRTICAEIEEASNFSISLKRLVSSDALIGSEKIFLQDRKNQSRTISFNVEKSFDSIALANKAIFELAQDISNVSPATLEILFNPLNPSEKIEIENVVLNKCKAISDSLVISFHFEFSDGYIY